MTPDEIDEMRADMEAGTPGPWETNGYVTFRTGDNGDWCGDICDTDVEPDARRIARVPQLEVEVLRLRRLLEPEA